MRRQRADLVFQHDDLTITVKDVPVNYCDACGEQYVPGPIGLEISDAVDRVVREARREREAGSHYVAREVVLSEGQLTTAGSR
jgi:YgiT-type zinc finger domain-containing protein